MPVVYISDKAKKELPIRRESDFYPTPQWYADGLVDYMAYYIVSNGPLEIIARDENRKLYTLDPGCGNDPVFSKAMDRAFTYPTKSVGIDIRPEAIADAKNHLYLAINTSLLDWDNSISDFDIITGNPPYNLAEQFVRKSLSLLRDAGWLGFLLPITFLASKGRSEGLYKEFPPHRVVYLGKRPSFFGGSGTAPTEYCFIIWQKGFVGIPTCDWLVINEPESIKKQRLQARRNTKIDKLILNEGN